MKRFICLFGLLMVALLAACGTTQLKASWKDPGYHGQPFKIMVIGVAKNPLNRRIFEDEFVRQLNAHGVRGIASYTVLSDRAQDDRYAIADRVRELGADTVLVTLLVSQKTVQVYVPGTPYFPPPYYATWQDYYLYGYQNPYVPGHMAEDEYAVIESNLYEAGNDKLIWAASSETVMGGSNEQLIRSYIVTMVNAMVEQGLLSR